MMDIASRRRVTKHGVVPTLERACLSPSIWHRKSLIRRRVANQDACRLEMLARQMPHWVHPIRLELRPSTRAQVSAQLKNWKRKRRRDLYAQIVGVSIPDRLADKRHRRMTDYATV